MLDRETFLRPIAHRGLHEAACGIVENSGPAFESAIAQGYGIECDLRPAADGTPMVFHDRALARLVDRFGETSDHAAADLMRMSYRDDPRSRILRLTDLIDLVRGRVPMLIEVKSEWEPAHPSFMAGIAHVLARYRGPFALMSFDPSVMAALAPLLPEVPRGIVSGLYDETWWPGRLDADRGYRLSHLIESKQAKPDFFAYHVRSLPTPVTRCLREGLGIPFFAWTVRTTADLETAARWADAPIFENIRP